MLNILEWFTEATPEFAEEWSKILKHYMELAGKLCLKTHLLPEELRSDLKADPYIDTKWIKD